MDQKSMWTYLLLQGPTIVFMAIVLYFLFDFMKKEFAKKDELIKIKDQQIAQLVKENRDENKAMNEKFIGITEKYMESTNKSNEIISGLKPIIERIVLGKINL